MKIFLWKLGDLFQSEKITKGLTVDLIRHIAIRYQEPYGNIYEDGKKFYLLKPIFFAVKL